MNLGDVIRTLGNEAAATEVLVGCGDLKVFLAVAEMASRYGESPGDYAAGAVKRFANAASDEDWLALMTALERTEDPARTCLVGMVKWSLKHDDAEPVAEQACGCGGHACGS